jgi:hypothetical protein
MATDFGWSYPPGVSGREYEIAGPDWAGEVHRTCGASVVTIKVKRFDDDETMDLDMDECPWIDGEVYAETFQGVMSWTCPLCGRLHEETRDD